MRVPSPGEGFRSPLTRTALYKSERMSERTRRPSGTRRVVVSTAAGSQTAFRKEPRGVKKSIRWEKPHLAYRRSRSSVLVHSMSSTNRASCRSAMTSMT